MAITIKFNDVDRSDIVLRPSISINRQVNGRCTCRMTTHNRFNSYNPVVGVDVKVYWDADLVFAGQVAEVEERLESGTSVLFRELQCTDYSAICSRRIVMKAWPEYTMYDIVQEMCEEWLRYEGITYEDYVANPGPVIPAITMNHCTVHDGFSQITQAANGVLYGSPESRGGFNWWIDFDKKLHLDRSTTVDAPISITDSSKNYLANSFRVNYSRGDFRTRQYVRMQEEAAELALRGEERTWVDQDYLDTEYPIDAATGASVEIDIGAGWVSKTVDEIDTPGVDYWYRLGYRGFRRNPDATDPGPTDKIRTYYTTSWTNSVCVTDDGEQYNRQVIEGGSGMYEAVSDEKQQQDPAILYSMAWGLALQNGEIASQVTFATHEKGLEPGQRISINRTAHGINGTYLIDGIDLRELEDGATFETRVRCSPDIAYPTWEKYLGQVINMARIGPIPAGTPAAEEPFSLTIAIPEDPITTGTDKLDVAFRLELPTGKKFTLQTWNATLKVAPSAPGLDWVLKRSTNNSSWTDALTGSIAASSLTGSGTTFGVAALNHRDYLRVDVTGIGSPNAGSGLSVVIQGILENV